jgi:hypothetical protein
MSITELASTTRCVRPNSALTEPLKRKKSYSNISDLAGTQYFSATVLRPALPIRVMHTTNAGTVTNGIESLAFAPEWRSLPSLGPEQYIEEETGYQKEINVFEVGSTWWRQDVLEAIAVLLATDRITY